MSGWLIGILIFGIIFIFASLIILLVLLMMPSSDASGGTTGGNPAGNANQRPSLPATLPTTLPSSLPATAPTVVEVADPITTVAPMQYVVTPMKFDTLKTKTVTPAPITPSVLSHHSISTKHHPSPAKKSGTVRSAHETRSSWESQSNGSRDNASDEYSDEFSESKYSESRYERPTKRNFRAQMGGDLTPFSDEISIMSPPREDFSTSYSIDVDSPREVVKK